MREILFRAWSEKEKCYRHNVGIYNGHAVRYGYQWYSLDNDVFDSNPEQFTGLVDRNGKKIFEGDIVHVDNYDEGWDSTVEFRGGAFAVDVESCEYDYTAIGWVEYEMEIISNIHEQMEVE